MKIRHSLSLPWASLGIAGLLIFSPSSDAALAGAWEDFWSKANTVAWHVFDYSDDSDEAPEWFDMEEEQFAYSWHTGDEPLWFYTDVTLNAGNGAFVGDYAIEKIQGTSCFALVDDIDEIEFIDCVLVGKDDNGEAIEYYGYPWYAEDLVESGWREIWFNFDEIWEVYDAETETFSEIELTPEMLTSISEVGFRFFPLLGSTAEGFAAIDDVTLDPLVESPELTTAVNEGSFQLSFTPGPGLFCWIEELKESPEPSWEIVEGQEAIVGPEKHLFTTPISAGIGLFRVQTEADYLPINTP